MLSLDELRVLPMHHYGCSGIAKFTFRKSLRLFFLLENRFLLSSDIAGNLGIN